jgi:hypothetical protein
MPPNGDPGTAAMAPVLVLIAPDQTPFKSGPYRKVPAGFIAVGIALSPGLSANWIRDPVLASINIVAISLPET